MLSEPPSDVWVFGYGSLIFRAGFGYAQRRVARLHGFERRFWQSSPDHRGTPGTPGRVVTLVENRNASVLGVAYLLRAAEATQILAELDERERAGYERIWVCLDFVDAPFGRASALVYQARAGNPGFVARESDEQIARRRARRSRPERRQRKLREPPCPSPARAGEDDPHVSAIARLLAEKP